MSDDLHIDDRVTIPGADLRWTAVRASGPGGQNVNKVATKVDLRFDLPGTQALSDEVKRRLQGLTAAKLDAAGRIRVVCQSSRNLSRNLELARETLAGLVRTALVRPVRRKKTRPTRASKLRRLDAKRVRSQTKAARGKVGRDH